MKFLLHPPKSHLLLGALAAVVFVSIASAFVLEGPKWSSASVTFQFRLGNAGKTLTDGNTSWDTAALPALDSWNRNCGLHLNGNVNGSAPLVSGDGINAIGFSNKAGGQSFGSGTLAITVYYYSGNRMSEADIFVNNAQTWDSYRGNLRYKGAPSYAAIADIRRVLIHEVGHAIGLNHPPNGVDAIMHASISDRNDVSSDDINGAHALYGLPAVGTSPTPTPAPTATPNPGAPSVNVSVAPAIARVGRPAIFTFALSSPQSSDTLINFSISGSSHLYRVSSPSQVTIPAGASTATVSLSPRKRPKRARAVTLRLNPSADYSVAAPSSARVTITR